ncbi:restriction endonuclease subunit S [Metallumcola ferriviriculae]|uniref:Restriction endonuclease subunit S n=1 Tax=Metallumcola ferriviriculae TaxID=3039180 RepID=A0AAU0UNV5_9FIRM|nr:restriction endonuclease subunit S [Desulfitibacteraceae bacterium MK1]
MYKNIDLALNVLYQRQLSSREQLLKEMLRVKMTLLELEKESKIMGDKDKLFQLMKKTTEDELGFFPADRDDFWVIFEALKDIDLVDFTLEIYRNDRMGTVISPIYLSSYITDRIESLQPKKILITEAEKHLSGLKEMIRRLQDSEISLTTQLKPMHILLQLAFGKYKNVKIRFESIYTGSLKDEKYDYIYSLPTFGHKPDEVGKTFLTRESDGIAVENMLGHLDDKATLDIILPAKITFAGLGYEKLRSYITEHFQVESIYILPDVTFRPATAIKTYLFAITAKSKANIEIGTLKLNKKDFEIRDKREISTKEFLSYKDWRIELLLADDDENIQRFKSSNVQKVKLKDVAEVFRGKSILKKDTSLGSISILNISNIEEGEINYSGMDTIDEEERKVKRYELYTGDVVLSCRGTAIKSAVFEARDKTIIVSANLIVIRPKEKVKGEYIKIFFESPIGVAIIKSLQRGTTIMNINHADIMEMEIPLLPISKQQEMMDRYHEELSIYKDTIKTAEKRWMQIKDSIYKDLI